MRYAVIMAGGAGKRLWPLSRQHRPKQLLPLVNGKSLLAVAVERLVQMFDEQNILVVTNAEYAEQVAEALPQLPPGNIVGEPEGRDTANAVALGAALVEGRDPEATMAVFTADHVIRPHEKFAEAVEVACDAAEAHPDHLLTFGIRPNWPHTGLGYIHATEQISPRVHRVEGFKEKPDHQTARRYVESGHYFWNSGMFVWKVGAIAQALEENLPESRKKLTPVTEAVRGENRYTDTLAEVYPTLEKISIDFAVMEKYPKVLMVDLQCEWLDVGSWPALQDVCEQDDVGNVILAKRPVILDSFRNVIVSEDDHLVAVLGMDDCIVVHSPDATLVCNTFDAQRIKELVGVVEEKYGTKFV